MGTWFITAAIGIKLGTMLATYTSSSMKYNVNVGFDTKTTMASYYGYQHLFGTICLVTIIIAIFAFVIGGKLNKMIQE